LKPRGIESSGIGSCHPICWFLREAGLLTLWLARPFSGQALRATDFIHIIEAISALDGSVGWCTCISAGYSRLSGFLAPNVVRRIFADSRPMLAGTLAPNGIARRADGGWRVSGRWAYGSGICHSIWVLGLCVEHRPDDADGAPKRLRIALFPADQAKIIDTWHVAGLRGTGSHDYAVDDLFIPDEHTIAGLAENAVQPGALYGMPLPSIFAAAIASVLLGIARGAIDTFSALAQDKPVMSTGGLLRDRSVVQEAIGRAEASLRAARAFLFEVVDMIWDIAANGGIPTLHQRALARLACTQVSVASKAAVQTTFELAGGSAVYAKAGLERRLRDIQTAGQHVSLQTIYFEHAGRVLLGLDPGTARF
jgi:indole-3-acetate monooxygenase